MRLYPDQLERIPTLSLTNGHRFLCFIVAADSAPPTENPAPDPGEHVLSWADAGCDPTESAEQRSLESRDETGADQATVNETEPVVEGAAEGAPIKAEEGLALPVIVGMPAFGFPTNLCNVVCLVLRA